MRIDETQHGQVTVLQPFGPLAGDDSSQLHGRLGAVVNSGCTGIILDASRISFVDSGGLEVLAEATEQLIRSGRVFKLCAANDIVSEVLQLTELHSLFEQFDSTEAALASF